MKKERLYAGLAAVGAAAAAAAAGYCLALRPRQDAPGWEDLAAYRYAHRGLHCIREGIQENSMSAFRAAVEHGFGAELDVHLMADGNLAVIHDSALWRVCGMTGTIEKLTAGELKDYPLLGNGDTIPLLDEVLDLFAGKTPLVIELKVSGGNAQALTDAVMEKLRNWPGRYCIESFHPAVLQRLREKYPDVIRGQLSQDFMSEGRSSGLPWPKRLARTYLLTTCLTRPDFIAYDHHARRNPSLRLMKRLYGVHEVGWTIRDRETMAALEAEGVSIIFERFIP